MATRTFILISVVLALGLSACEQPVRPPVVPPIVDPPIISPPPVVEPAPDRPTVTVLSVTPSQTGAQVRFEAQAAANSVLSGCILSATGAQVGVTLEAESAVRTVNLSGLEANTRYILTLNCSVKNAANKTNSTRLSIEVTTLPAPQSGQGGTKSGFDPSFDPALDYVYQDLEQVLPSGERAKLRYLRGSFPLTAFLPAGQEYYLSNTVTNASNAISGTVDSRLLNQGQLYTLIARRPSTQPGGGEIVSELRIVPDNLGPQIADVQPNKGIPGNGYLSKLSVALSSAYGNWVGGGTTASGFDPSAARFTVRLDNTRRIEDQPVPGATGSVNPPSNAAQWPVGISVVRYYAQPVAAKFVGNLKSALSGDASPLLIGEVRSNDVSGNPALNNYPATVQTVAGGSVASGNLWQLGDGNTRYAVFGVAYDRLGNPSLDRAVSSATYNATAYPLVLINVDNAAPTLTAPSVVDRGPLDVHAKGEGCERINVALEPLRAPSDVFTAEAGFVSGCAVIASAVADTGVGFDFEQVVGGGNLVNIGAPASGLSGSAARLGLTITARGAATLKPTVINLNDLAGPQTFTLQNVSDMLGNVAAPKSTAVTVDNEEPSSLVLSVASENSSNTYAAWQQVGLSISAQDAISGLRQQGDVAPTAILYGGDFNPLEFQGNLALGGGYFNNTLVQIAPANFTNFHIPMPGISRVRGVTVSAQGIIRATVEGNLNLWGFGADRAGNAAAERETVQVHSDVTLTQALLSSLSPQIRDDVGTTEVGSPPNSYRGFTALNYTPNGVVPLGTRDELDAGPEKLNPALSALGQLPASGSNGTALYRLTTPDQDLINYGDSALETGLGAVSYLKRWADPIVAVTNANPFATIQTINPASYWPNSVADQATRRTGSFRYNLPAWSVRLDATRRIGHLWETLATVESRPYNADVEADAAPDGEACPEPAAGQPVPGCRTAISRGGVALVVFNNLGFPAVQAKGNLP